MAQRHLLGSLNNLKKDSLEIQHPKFENSRLGFIESVHEDQWQMQHPSRRLAPGWALICSQTLGIVI